LENFLLAVRIVMPLFLLMAVGFAVRFFGLIDKRAADGINDAVFRVFLPVMLFKNLYETSIGDAFSWKLVVFAYVGVAVIVGLSMLIIPRLVSDDSQKGVLVQAIFRSNYVIFGLPLTEAILGKGQAGSTALLIACIVPLFNTLSVCLLEYYRGGGVKFRVFVKNVLTNPLVIASAVGISFLLLGIKLPDMLMDTVSTVSSVSSPLALIGLGAAIEFKKVPGNAREIAIGTLGRLVAVPLLGLPAAVLCGFRGAPLVALLALFATPTAVSTFTLARGLDGDSELAAELVVSTCTFSVFSVFAAVYALICFGLV